MNRKAYVSILAFVFLAFVFLTGCNNSSSKPPVETMTLPSGSPQSTAGDTAFAASLVVQVTTGGSPDERRVGDVHRSVVGSERHIRQRNATETDTTDMNGLATSSTFTANTTTGAYTVTATISGLPTVNFSLTNTADAGIDHGDERNTAKRIRSHRVYKSAGGDGVGRQFEPGERRVGGVHGSGVGSERHVRIDLNEHGNGYNRRERQRYLFGIHREWGSWGL